MKATDTAHATTRSLGALLPRVIAWDDVKRGRECVGGPDIGVWRTFFMAPGPGSREPQAFLVEYVPGRVLRKHFHDVDEFQLVVAGDGVLGHHRLQVGTLHFARAHTGYGPIVAGPQGLSFLTLRAQRDSAGPQWLPEHRDALLQVPRRQPWQAADLATFADGALEQPHCAVQPLQGLENQARARQRILLRHPAPGLAAWAVSATAGRRLQLPEAGPGGQYVVQLAAVPHVGEETSAVVSLGFVPAGDAALDLAVGPDGMRAVVCNFPKPY